MMTTLLNDAVKNSIKNYRQAGIEITIEENTLIIKQTKLINGLILTNKQLYNRAKEILPNDLIKIVPVVYSLNVGDITVDWINAKMKEFGIYRNDLIRQLAIDKSTLSLYFSNERALTKTAKAAFYYYFLVYELNRDLREKL